MSYVSELEQQNDDLKKKLAYMQEKFHIDVYHREDNSVNVYIKVGKKINLQLASIFKDIHGQQTLTLKYLWGEFSSIGAHTYLPFTKVDAVISDILKKYELDENEIDITHIRNK